MSGRHSTWEGKMNFLRGIYCLSSLMIYSGISASIFFVTIGNIYSVVISSFYGLYMLLLTYLVPYQTARLALYGDCQLLGVQIIDISETIKQRVPAWEAGLFLRGE